MNLSARSKFVGFQMPVTSWEKEEVGPCKFASVGSESARFTTMAPSKRSRRGLRARGEYMAWLDHEDIGIEGSEPGLGHVERLS